MNRTRWTLIVAVFVVLGISAATPTEACNSRCFDRWGCSWCDFSLYPGTLCWDAVSCSACIEWDCPDPGKEQPFPSPTLQADEDILAVSSSCTVDDSRLTEIPQNPPILRVELLPGRS